MTGNDPEANAAERAMERLRTAHERAEHIVAERRLQSFLDSLDHDDYERALPYIGQPFALTLIKIGLRLEQHVAQHTDSHSHVGPWRTFGMAAGAAIAGAAATVAAIRETMK